jgi:hypothetical protein
MRPQGVQIIGEDVVGTEQTFNAHSGGDVSHLEQPTEIDDREHQHAEHAVSAVDQSQTLLFTQCDGCYAGGCERFACRHERARCVPDYPLTHEGQGTVGKRGEVTGTAEAAVLIHDWGESGVDHGDITPQGLLADSGAAGGKGGNPQQHQCSYDLTLNLRSGTGGVRADQAALQLATKIDGNVASRQGPKPGRYAVMRLLIIG